MTAMRGDGPRKATHPPHPDRVGLQPWLLAATAGATAVCAGVAGGAAASARGASPLIGFALPAAAAAGSVLAMRSVSVRLVARLFLVLSAGLLIRFGSFDGSLASGSQAVLAWVVAGVAVFVLTDRIGTDAQPPITPVDAPRTPFEATGDGRGVDEDDPGRADVARTSRAGIATALAVLVLVLVATPLALPHLTRETELGDGPQLQEDDGGTGILRSTERLDMTTRPDLTDEVVLRVTSDRRTFWRGETFDRWDGRIWTRADPSREVVPSDGTLTLDPDDLGLAAGDRFVQQIRVEATYADVIFAAPSAVRVDAGRTLAQRPDGTVTTAGVAMGRGATYEVESRRPALSPAILRAAEGPVPDDIAERYAAEPVMTDRVQEAAESVAGDADTTYDKVRALERWMGERAEYSLDAPLSPTGVDVVDHFLFESQEGWCEQIASSLVVLARANGIPARLVTGYVPDERDAVTGTWVVRARNAHAWAEVWFPELGWVPFDPTADVPLAGAEESEQTWGRWLLDHAVVIGLVLAAVGALGWPLLVLVRRWRRRRADRPTSWAGAVDARLAALGAAVGHQRAVGETSATFARFLADRYGDEGLVEVGRAVDDSLFAPEPPDPDRRAAVDAALDRVEAAPVPDPEPAPPVPAQ